MFDKNQMQAFEEFKDLMVDENEDLEKVSGGIISHDKFIQQLRDKYEPILFEMHGRDLFICEKCNSNKITSFGIDYKAEQIKGYFSYRHTCANCGAQTVRRLSELNDML